MGWVQTDLLSGPDLDWSLDFENPWLCKSILTVL